MFKLTASSINKNLSWCHSKNLLNWISEVGYQAWSQAGIVILECKCPAHNTE